MCRNMVMHRALQRRKYTGECLGDSVMHGVLTSTESVHAPNVYTVMRHVLVISRLSPERHLLATLLIIFTMPGKPWTTNEQASFLHGYVPQYLAAQKDGTVSAFWPRVLSRLVRAISREADRITR